MAKSLDLLKLLEGWGQLNAGLMSLGESEVAQLFELEKMGKARLRFLLRIHNRFSKLRGSRERVEIARMANG